MPISVRVHPNAGKSELVGFSDDAWQVKVSAPPVKGKANVALLALLSRALGISRSHLSIVKGHTSRRKIINVDGMSEAEVTKRLSSSAASSK
ncbi:DUF167 domain-containing protein [Chloroflexota bacterium]